VDKHFPNNTTESTIQFIDKFAVDKMQGVVEKTCLGLADYINAYAPKLRAKKENIVDCMVSVSKKRYFMSVYNSEGVQYKEPKMKVMGLQMVKSSTPAVIRQVLRDSLKTILYGSEADVQEFCKKVHEDFRKFSCSEIAFPRGVNDIHKYHSQSHIYSKGAPIHVRGSLLYNYYLKEKNLSNYPLITDGDKIKFVYLKMPNPIKEDVISFIDEMPKELGLEEYIDYELMFQKTFLDAIQNILDSMRWSATPKATLDDLFDWS
jgi:DNA polymerase elongation subunit (family B)